MEHKSLLGNTVMATETDKVAVLCQAAQKGDVATVRRLAREIGDVNARDEQGNTALILAAKERRAESVATLLELGADPDVLSARGSSAVRWAAAKGDATTLRLLLEHGAKPDVRKAGDYYNDAPALHLAALLDSAECVGLLLDHGAQIDLRDTALHRTALLAALDTDPSPKAARLLIKRGADINARDKHGDTPLKEAIGCQCHEVVDLLRRAGAST